MNASEWASERSSEIESEWKGTLKLNEWEKEKTEQSWIQQKNRNKFYSYDDEKSLK